ncbi:extracellular solute-binding protein, partial [bacterium]|nr:extracellular solute-binding protein [bacterium]
YVLCANMDMLRAAGFDRPPETWEELRETARACTLREPGRSNPKVYGFLMRAGVEAYSVPLFRAGEGYLSEDFREVTLDTPLALGALDLLAGMVSDGSAYIDTTYPAIPFGSEQVAMYIHSSAAIPFNERNIRGKFEWSAAPVPYPPGHEGGILFQGTNIGIFSRPHSPKVRRAAWRFLKFITNTRNAARWSIATGYVPVRRSSVDLPEMREFLAEHPNNKVPIDLILQAVFDPKPHYWDQMRSQIESYALEAINGQRPPKEALQIMSEKLREIIEYEVGNKEGQ